MNIPDAVRSIRICGSLGERKVGRHASRRPAAGARDYRGSAPTTCTIAPGASPPGTSWGARHARSWCRREVRSLADAFPFEFGAILAAHVVVSGTDPFAGLRVNAADLRRASEIQARSHLLHLREGYLETHGRSDAVADLIVRSAPSLAALVTSVARLHGIVADGAEAAAQAIEHVAALLAGREVITLSGGR
jgi:hypothetical protein